MSTEETVYIVDDNTDFRESLRALMESAGLTTETYAGAQDFLDGYNATRPGCMVLDIQMPGMNGLDLQEKLAKEGIHIPVIVLSAHGNVEKAVRAMKTGAVDFIRKPYEAEALMDRVWHALELDEQRRKKDAERADVAERMGLLTPRQFEVMELLVAGKAPKEIAYALGLSRKTADV
ncbi:MAG: response regulator transcription factor, partial [Planctomycetota bacterium]